MQWMKLCSIDLEAFWVRLNVKLTGTLRRAGFGLGFWSPNLDCRKVSG